MLEIFYLDRSIKKGDEKSLRKLKRYPLWIDACNLTKKEGEILKEVFDLHPLTVEDLVHANTRIKIEEYPNYLFCVFYSVVNSHPISLIDLDFVVGKNFVISNHKLAIHFFDELKANPERLMELFRKGSDFLFYELLDSEIENFFPVLEVIDEDIEEIETKVTNKPKSDIMPSILKLKRQVITIKKIALPQRDKLSSLAKNRYKFISEKAMPYFRDIYDDTIRVADSIENYREAITNTFEVYMSAISYNMGEVMKILSIIATTAIPLTVISGIYGTNFKYLPGSEWRFGFYAMVGLMGLMVGFMAIFFKRKNWF